MNSPAASFTTEKRDCSMAADTTTGIVSTTTDAMAGAAALNVITGENKPIPPIPQPYTLIGETPTSVHASAGVFPSSSSELNRPSGSLVCGADAPPMQHRSRGIGRAKSLEVCRVCGDGPARMHYGVPTCFGCKGFFRRTLKRTKEYTCRYNGNCVVDRYERNSCRYCRFKCCLEVGMDPKAVRPDRDAAGRIHPIRHRRNRLQLEEMSLLNGEEGEGEGLRECEWIRKLPVDMRTLLMQLMNNELLIASGDTGEDAKSLYPLPFNSLREILEDPSLLDGKRVEMRYDPYKEVRQEELIPIAHRRLIASIDTVDHLCALMDLNSLEDKLALVKAGYAPLSLFSAVAATAQNTRNRDLLCLCCFGYVSREPHGDLYHFANRLVERTLDELVEPFRAFNFKEQEVTLMKAILTLNPHIRRLSTEAAEQVADLRDRVQEALYNVVRESHPKEVASSRFGNLLLFLPNIMILGNVMYENLQFIQSFGRQNVDPLLGELLDNIEPIQDLNGVNLDDVLSLTSSSTDQSCDVEGAHFLRSQSSSSLSSSFSNTHYQSLQFPLSQLPNEGGSGLMLPSDTSDADYNITLTAETFTGRRNTTISTMNAVQSPSMEVDSMGQSTMGMCEQAGQLGHSTMNQPKFFLDHIGQASPSPQPMYPATTHIGTRHLFTVETVEPTIPSMRAKFVAGQQQQQGQYVGMGYCPNAPHLAFSQQSSTTSLQMSKSQSYPHNLMSMGEADLWMSPQDQQQQHHHQQLVQSQQLQQHFFAASQPPPQFSNPTQFVGVPTGLSSQPNLPSSFSSSSSSTSMLNRMPNGQYNAAPPNR